MNPNGSFETADVRAYDAVSWTVFTVAASGEGAYTFSVFVTSPTDSIPDTAEAFAAGWGTGVFIPGFVGFYTYLTYGFMDGGLKTDEDFEDLWGAGPARISSGNGPFVLSNGMDLRVSVDGAPYQAIGFLTSQFENIADARPQEVVDAINAAGPTGFYAVLVGATVQLRSIRTGLVATLQVTGGTAATPLGFPGTVASGTADGSPWLHFVEFGLLDPDGYETDWGDLSLDTDAGDATDRYTPPRTDNYEEWWDADTDPDPTDIASRYVVFGLETYETGWA